MPQPQALIIGGYGVFGSLVAQELAAGGISLTIAGRDPVQGFSAAAKALGPDHHECRIDLRDQQSCEAAIQDHFVVVNCAGPFQSQDATLLRACLSAGCHYVDIADNPGYVQRVQALTSDFRERDLSAVWGCSSLPAISGALGLAIHEPNRGSLRRTRSTLFIGNRNPKGAGAVQSLLGALGTSIPAPQGSIRVFRDGELVPLPAPFGPRRVYNFNSPDYQLFPKLFGTPSVSVKVGFELSLVNSAFAALARCTRRGVGPFASLMGKLGGLVGGLGCSGGIVMTELFYENSTYRQAACVAEETGQRMAIIPCVWAVEMLLRNPAAPRGAYAACAWLGHSPLLDRLRAAGYDVTSGPCYEDKAKRSDTRSPAPQGRMDHVGESGLGGCL